MRVRVCVFVCAYMRAYVRAECVCVYLFVSACILFVTNRPKTINKTMFKIIYIKLFVKLIIQMSDLFFVLPACKGTISAPRYCKKY